MAELSERKKQILATVVEQYIKTGEPIGSKELLALTGMTVSSATVRNEMSELVSLGYLEQPHTSAGRVSVAGGLQILCGSPDEGARSLTSLTAS